MRMALWHAERGRGSTAPNPIVGAVIVDADGVIVGVGHHQYAGGPHAEIVALQTAGRRARGAVLYCTLEPCSHTNRTGPCAVAVASAGIGRVVVATVDPNPRVSGAGLRYLRERGVEVTLGVGRAEAAVQNAPFLSVMTRGRPWVVAKVAMSLDGRVAGAPGERTTITGPEAQRWTQRYRAGVDAVAVGASTVLIDDPVLTVREVYRHRPLSRIVFDRRLRVTPAARLFTTLDAGPVAIVTSGERAGSVEADALRAAGATILPCNGTLDDGLRRLVTIDVLSVLVEGGPTLHAALWQAGLIDRVAELVADRALGPDGVPTGIMDVTARLRRRTVTAVGRDVLLEGDVHRAD